jgi:hypothetical protein
MRALRRNVAAGAISGGAGVSVVSLIVGIAWFAFMLYLGACVLFDTERKD